MECHAGYTWGHRTLLETNIVSGLQIGSCMGVIS